jgi:hypothetical protein
METTDNKKKAGRKTNVVNYESRIPEAMEMMLYEKMSYTEFRTEAAKRFNISERMAESIWKEIRDKIKARFDEKSDEIIEQQLQRTFDLLKRCRDSGNKRTEAEVLRDLNKLYGLDVKKVDVTSGGNPVSININLSE